MARTTLDIDADVLHRLRLLQGKEGKSLGQLVSELLIRVLAEEAKRGEDLPPLDWPAKALGLKVDLEDREGLWRVLDER